MKKNIITTIAILLFVITLNFISAVSIVDVSSFPEEVAPGQIIEISIEIENVFDYDITNLNVKLDLVNTDFAWVLLLTLKFRIDTS